MWLATARAPAIHLAIPLNFEFGKEPSWYRSNGYIKSRKDAGPLPLRPQEYDPSASWFWVSVSTTIRRARRGHTEIPRMNSKTRLIFDSRKELRGIMCCSVNMALLARFWIILVTNTNALLTPRLSTSFGCREDAGIEMAGPMKRRKTILPTPTWGAVAFTRNRSAVHTAIWWKISRNALFCQCRNKRIVQGECIRRLHYGI